MKKADRLEQLPDYPFAYINQLKATRKAKNLPIHDLGVGAPDLPTPEPIIRVFQEAMIRQPHQVYSGVLGRPEFHQAVARYYQRRFQIDYDGLELDCLPLAGSKEGLAKAPLAFVNPGEVILVPNPGYPVYNVAHLWCEARAQEVDLVPEDGFQMDPDRLARLIDELKLNGQKPVLLYLNFPNNPTGASADRERLTRVVEIARREKILILYDNAYADICLHGSPPPPSIFQIPGASETALEFHSLSKTFSMTGWRVAFVAGRKDLVLNFRRLKSNFDSGLFTPLQLAGAHALDHLEELSAPLLAEISARQKITNEALDSLGLEYLKSNYTFYVWIRLPEKIRRKYTVGQLSERALKEFGLIFAPGTSFGSAGEGYIRFALTLKREGLLTSLEVFRRFMDEL